MSTAHTLRAGTSGGTFDGNPGDVLTLGSGGKASFQPGGGPGSGLTSFNGRTTPAVVPAAGDYNISQIGGGPATDQQIPVWSSSLARWVPTTASPGGVTSWNTRSGAVVPVAGDYTSTLITNASAVAGGTVTAALNALAAVIAGLTIATTAPLAGGGLVQSGLTLSVAAASGGSSGVVPAVGAAGTLAKSSGSAVTWGAIDPTVLNSLAASPAANQFLQGNGPGVAASWGTLFSSPANPGDNSKLAIALNGDFTYAFLSDANIAANANISTSKIAPAGTAGQALITTGGVPAWGTNFGAQNLTTTGQLNAATLSLTANATIAGVVIVGTNPAATGNIRLPNSGTIVGRNAANSADVTLAQINGANGVTIGLNTGVSTVTAASTSGLIVNIAGVNQFTFTTTALTSLTNTIVFDPTVTNAIFGMGGVAVGNGNTLTLSSCNTTAASANGGLLIVAGGASLNATPGLAGGVKLRIDQNVSNPTTMIELYQLAATRRIIALFGQSTTTAQMGVNTGDYVMYVANAGTVPSADATSGYIQYADGGKPAWRFNATNFRLNGTSATASAGGGATLPATVLQYLDVQVTPVGGGAAVQGKIPIYAA